MNAYHKSVLVNEVLSFFAGRELKFFFDGTLGAGGHAQAILSEHPEIEVYVACDRDPDAIALARDKLKQWEEKLRFFHGNYSELKKWLDAAEIAGVDGVLIDAGVSSMQLDRSEKGFSFQKEGPLDMRMNPSSKLTAQEIVNHWRQEEIEKILKEYGEEPRARAVAKAIVDARKKKLIQTTKDLVEVIRPVAKGKPHLHPATLTFQAIRIAVNDELQELQTGIDEAIEALRPDGRIVVISFQRLEDRIVKTSFRDKEIKKKKPSNPLKLLTKKPLGPSQEEAKANPRSRSAKLRAAEKG